MSLIAWLVSFMFIENVVVTWGTGLQNLLPVFSRIRVRQMIATSLFIVISTFVSWIMFYLLDLLFGLALLGFFVNPILVFMLSILLRKVFSNTFLKGLPWLPNFHFTLCAPFLVSYLIALKNPPIIEAFFAVLGSGLGYFIVTIGLKFVIANVSFESFPKKLNGLPLYFIVLSVMSVIFTVISHIFSDFSFFWLTKF